MSQIVIRYLIIFTNMARIKKSITTTTTKKSITSFGEVVGKLKVSYNAGGSIK